ncbi:DUF1766-domain-containing protein [Pseudovirgaria hyperparasitica]|uniref:DUF1766-domain-containing protein n=1 Tax=Pseudovirgaria hyperparasitica TaxID=470096 RepID=A0A6A6W2N7_9PEZI|nr:DUF1766-domain-containing protein [Pseudovirgaria hyperparasitica]KAF2756220.1 DUF1766-domain-containing protein [Pseudovirgaria hyperparasitica]
MPVIHHTPEALLPRSDSKNPSTTCKGITSSGRPCRRALAVKTKRPSGVLAVVSVGNDRDAAAFFCWQHQDQADLLTVRNNDLDIVEEETTIIPLRERSSIDTLVQRLGVLEFENNVPEKEARSIQKRTRQDHSERYNAPTQGIARPRTWENVSGPVMIARRSDSRFQKPPYMSKPAAKPRKIGFWQFLCCGSTDTDHDGLKQVRRREAKQRQQESTTIRPSYQKPMEASRPHSTEIAPNHQSATVNPTISRIPARKTVSDSSVSPANSLGQQTNPMRSPKQNMKSPIPTSLPPAISMSLLRYLSSPPSLHDEPGYIYMFWLTPSTTSPPPQRTSSTLLSARPDIPRGRRASDVLSEYSSARSNSLGKMSTKLTKPATILLKIGRTDNVWRRMREWGQQCGTVPNLLRYYPYVASSPAVSPSGSSATSPAASPGAHPRRASLQPTHQQRPDHRRARSSGNGVRHVPHATRVERLIHLELADQQVDIECACGTTHREWFEVEATLEGVRRVDEVCRRWVEWDESGRNLGR